MKAMIQILIISIAVAALIVLTKILETQARLIKDLSQRVGNLEIVVKHHEEMNVEFINFDREVVKALGVCYLKPPDNDHIVPDLRDSENRPKDMWKKTK